MKRDQPSAESRRPSGGRELWRKEAPLGARLGAYVLLIEALPGVGVRPVPAPGALRPRLPGVGLFGNAAPRPVVNSIEG